jgi:hypothetical protein
MTQDTKGTGDVNRRTAGAWEDGHRHVAIASSVYPISKGGRPHTAAIRVHNGWSRR